MVYFRLLLLNINLLKYFFKIEFRRYLSILEYYDLIALRGRFELPLPIWRTSSQEALNQEKIEVTKQKLERYLQTCELSGLSQSWMWDMNTHSLQLILMDLIYATMLTGETRQAVDEPSM